MSERPEPDDEIAFCHVCKRKFATQKDLLAHLEADHDGGLLTGETAGVESRHTPRGDPL
jgi:hypothetical protein